MFHFFFYKFPFFPLMASKRNPWAFMNTKHCHFHTHANAYSTPQKPLLSHRTPYPRRSWVVARRRPPINSYIRRTNIAGSLSLGWFVLASAEVFQKWTHGVDARGSSSSEVEKELIVSFLPEDIALMRVGCTGEACYCQNHII
ncbi:uncharacterized protein K444DRAFT_267657 [Hyaloscypha bicolor E]|uniref:Uncharacterized protein n=1 Tax=Hyaloscypha bicolor E TaxID=1095630 RepID=A0A2J6SI00_9HELO|nr:uncharacterized protein K444DRAFT_267657 [Hyaloscypha bicolor E]PMD50396.1 hypothetical protein K444DRAFT_267657 [Hyaloscypha bicolor E]